MRMVEIEPAGLYDTAAETMGKIFVTTELGGGGTARAETVAIARHGVRNLLRHAGVLSGAPEPMETRWLDMPPGCYVFAEDEGLIEPCCDLGEAVEAGRPVARIYAVTRTGIAPVEYRAGIAGMLAARHFPGRVQAGDCIAVIAQPSVEVE
jgi:N-alpha-acetyl-L-2,4-diaminobutyrate deacetylase